METDLLLSSARPSPPSADVKLALAGFLLPGRRSLRAAGVLDTVACAATAAGFFAVAAIAQDVFDRGASWGRDWRWLAMLAGAAAVRAGASYLAARLALDGALAVESHLRSRLLQRLTAGAGASLSGAAQATAVIDEVERVGAYAERYEPARLAAVVVPAILLLVVFPLSWPVGLLLVLCLPLPPLNLSIVGMGTADVARRHGEELRYLSGYFLDRLRGLPTLRALDAEAGELGRIRVASQRLSAASMAVLRVAFLSAAVLEAIVTLSVAVVAMYVGLTLLGYVHVPGLPSHLSLGTGLFVLMVTPLYFQPMRALATAYHERADALAATEALARCWPLTTPLRSTVSGDDSFPAPPDRGERAERSLPRPRPAGPRRRVLGDRLRGVGRRHRRLGGGKVHAAACSRRGPGADGRRKRAHRRCAGRRDLSDRDHVARATPVLVRRNAGRQHRSGTNRRSMKRSSPRSLWPPASARYWSDFRSACKRRWGNEGGECQEVRPTASLWPEHFSSAPSSSSWTSQPLTWTRPASPRSSR